MLFYTMKLKISYYEIELFKTLKASSLIHSLSSIVFFSAKIQYFFALS